ncbi:MAG: hypothetical protein HC873_06040, partial [Leptolyngbyaceae cyanobacterium SL_1_1]|nr:hypothetical protein [Leptolyngbyaceae cyanobacterium SL_1_1]
LLVVVGPQTGDRLPSGICLRIRDAQQLLVEQVLLPQSLDSYLYAQVVGRLDEQFFMSIALPAGPTIDLPPIAFGVDNEL